MTIGQAARAVGVSPKAIRLWEAQGLISKVERTPVGYRCYAAGDLASMQFIRQAKALGLTLAEIREVLALQAAGEAPCDHVRHLIEQHIAQIDRAIADLQQLRGTLTAAQDVATTNYLPQGDHHPGCHIIERAELAKKRERHIYRG